ncbi:MAG TPA: hypothetical protein VGN12_06605 [Pirellulales bacterium]
MKIAPQFLDLGGEWLFVKRFVLLVVHRYLCFKKRRNAPAKRIGPLRRLPASRSTIVAVNRNAAATLNAKPSIARRHVAVGVLVAKFSPAHVSQLIADLSQ